MNYQKILGAVLVFKHCSFMSLAEYVIC